MVNMLENNWPGLKMVHGKPRHSQSQGSVERANRDVEAMLATAMADSKSSHAKTGLLVETLDDGFLWKPNANQRRPVQ